MSGICAHWTARIDEDAPKWFALSQDRPLFGFAGLWTYWRGVRGPKSAPVDGQHELFGFLTTEVNAVVAPIHPKAMPVILTPQRSTCGCWLMRQRLSNCNDRFPTMRCELSRAVKRKMAPQDAALRRDQEPMLPL